jgi:hypothetical protein
MKRFGSLTLLLAGAVLAVLVIARLDAADPPDEMAQLAAIPGGMPQGVHEFYPAAHR